jgi:hypothetical protein
VKENEVLCARTAPAAHSSHANIIQQKKPLARFIKMSWFSVNRTFSVFLNRQNGSGFLRAPKFCEA